MGVRGRCGDQGVRSRDKVSICQWAFPGIQLTGGSERTLSHRHSQDASVHGCQDHFEFQICSKATENNLLRPNLTVNIGVLQVCFCLSRLKCNSRYFKTKSGSAVCLKVSVSGVLKCHEYCETSQSRCSLKYEHTCFDLFLTGH